MRNISPNDLLLLVFLATLIGLVILLVVVWLLFKKKVIFDRFVSIFVVIQIFLLSLSTALGTVAIVNCISFLRFGYPYMNMSTESLQPYMLYAIISVMITILLGLVTVYVTIQTYWLKRKRRKRPQEIATNRQP